MLKKIEKEMLKITKDVDLVSIVFYRKDGKAFNISEKIPKKISGRITAYKELEDGSHIWIKLTATTSKQIVDKLKLVKEEIADRIALPCVSGASNWMVFYKKDFEDAVRKAKKSNKAKCGRFRGGINAVRDELFTALEQRIYKRGKREGYWWKNRTSARGSAVEIGAFFDASKGENIIFVEQRMSISPIFQYCIQYKSAKAKRGNLEQIVEQSYAQGDYFHNPKLMVKNAHRPLLIKLLKKYEGIDSDQAKELLKKIEL